MKQYTKQFAAALAVASGLAMIVSAQAQPVTGTAYLSNIPASGAGSPTYQGYWNTPLTTITSTSTGLEFNAPGGSGSFSQLTYNLPVGQQTVLDPADTLVTLNFLWNSGDAVGGVQVVWGLIDSDNNGSYYFSGYNVPTPGLNSYTFAIQDPTLTDIQGGAVINQLNLQIDPANVSGNYDMTYSSITFSTVPERATFALAGMGVLGLLVFRRRYKVS